MGEDHFKFLALLDEYGIETFLSPHEYYDSAFIWKGEVVRTKVWSLEGKGDQDFLISDATCCPCILLVVMIMKDRLQDAKVA